MDKKLIGIALIALVIGFGIGILAAPKSDMLGAGQPNRFPNGYIDTGYGYKVNGVEVINSSGVVTVGTITSNSSAFTGGLVSSGATTLSSTSTISGTATLTCPKVYNGATTTTAYYIYASGTTLFATTTKPAICP